MKLTNTSKQSVGVDHRGEHVTLSPGNSIDVDSKEDWNNHLFVKAGWLVLEDDDTEEEMESDEETVEDDTETEDPETQAGEDTEIETESEAEGHAETNTADAEVSETGTVDADSSDSVADENAGKGEYVIHHKSKGWYDVIGPDSSVMNETALREADAQALADRLNDGNNG